MYKVIFGVQKVSLNLDNVYCQVIIRKNKQTIDLTNKVPLKQGLAFFDALTQFFIIQNDPLFLIQVLLMQKQNKKLGGEARLNISDWDQNTHYSTVAKLDKSPDSNAAICYTFTYYKSDSKGVLGKIILLCNQVNENVLSHLKNQNRKLTLKNQNLQNDIQNLQKERRNLKNHEMKMDQQLTNKRRQHQVKIGECMNDLNIKKQSFKSEQKLNNEMIDLIYSLGNSKTRQKLAQKYPHFKNPANISKEVTQSQNCIKRKKSTKSQKSKQQTGKDSSDAGQQRERSRNKSVKS